MTADWYEQLPEMAKVYMQARIRGASDVVDAVAHRLAAEEKDAARYRFLRDLHIDSPHNQIVNMPGDMWDAETDRAMDAEYEKGDL